MEFQAVLEAVRALPVDDRVRLVDHIYDDMRELANDPDMTPEQIQEIRRRVAAYDADPTIGIPWEVVEADVAKQLEELGE